MSAMQILEVPMHAVISLTLAANVTGVDPDYLALTAARESNFQFAVKARTSSAQGMFQFVDQTWLRIVATDGHHHGLRFLGRHIKVDAKGRHFVSSPRIRRRILGLRKDPTLAAIMAARLAKQNAKSFKTLTGRKPSNGELYVAHFLGAGGAAKLSKLMRAKPKSPAHRHFRRAARANKPIFYDGKRPRSIRAVYRKLVRRHQAVRVVFPKHRQAGTQMAPDRTQPRIKHMLQRRTVATKTRKFAFSGMSELIAYTEINVEEPEHTATINPARPDLDFLARLMRSSQHGK